MGANSQQGWALLLFLIGFTFFPAGLFALGPISFWSDSPPSLFRRSGSTESNRSSI